MRTNRQRGKLVDIWINGLNKPGCLSKYTILRSLGVILLVLAAISAWGRQARAETPSHWLYLRDGRSLDVNEEPVELIMVGDVMMGRTVHADERTLAQIAPVLLAADLVVGNFEGVIAPKGRDPLALSQTAPGEPYRLVMGRWTPGLLKNAGFDLLSLANNHALDLNASGLAATLQELRAAGLETFGANSAAQTAPEPKIFTLGSKKIAFLGFTMIPPGRSSVSGPLPARFERDLAREAIRAANDLADVVVVMIHWGNEYQTRVDPAQRRVAQELVEAGADLVVGAHPHVVQGTEIFPGREKEGFVAYSLGNFVFDQFEGETRQGLALRAYLDQVGLRAVEALPLQAMTKPRLLPLEQTGELLERVKPADLPAEAFGCDLESCKPVVFTGRAYSGLFSEGQIDLTGDGKPERVRLSGSTVQIEQDGEIVWTSPLEWQVIDLALGDPNDDGRYELLISLRKPDTQGVLRSHPFIVGYRKGTYKLLWGGSALSTPVTQVELGDVDGDEAQELLALEEAPGGRSAISVWNWHGWGFSLQWRSEPDDYSDIAVTRPAKVNPASAIIFARLKR